VIDSESTRSAKSTPKFASPPPVTWPGPAGIHEKYECSHGCRYASAIHVATSAERPVEARAKKFVHALFFGRSGRANARTPLSSAPIAGRSGTRRSVLAIQLSGLVDVHGALQPVQLNDDGQPDRGLPRGDGDHEDGEYLAVERGDLMGKSDEVHVHRVEHQLDGHQHGN